MAEHIRGSLNLSVEVLTKICNNMLDGGKMPEERRNSILMPIYKGKEDVKQCGSYRGLKLLEHAMKVVVRVLERRLRETVVINEMQLVSCRREVRLMRYILLGCYKSSMQGKRRSCICVL